jgi:hypothetical protein
MGLEKGRLHLGGIKPGDDIHRLICDAASNWRALRIRSSRSFPLGKFAASFWRLPTTGATSPLS